MVKITNGAQVLTVTHNAFKEVFQRAGYRLYTEHTQQEHKQEQPTKAMKPISMWTRQELEEYLTKHGMDTQGKIDELRELAKAHMEKTY
jgi:DNA-binding MurR/RpiR family transcriptional regulator